MTNLTTFNDGQPWFVAADVCRVLGYANATEMVRPLDAKDRTKNFLGHTVANLISEAGLYQIIMRAQRTNPLPRPFQGWVTRIVLPATRKDAMYVVGEERVAAGEMLLALVVVSQGLVM
ncbi:BRO family protein [Ensifer sp. ENS04]|uniref:BRO-N domain-containing protein n=1 Tax=Ensifer sp. ENS04 TaxID=2769281 RepID=UPI001786FB13|nr:BRO family protein [Ensifer sp. ENS04]MBD9541733.1 BRO family protein [Ensifer sp. ENS04]